jgi:hypothetical protein
VSSLLYPAAERQQGFFLAKEVSVLATFWKPAVDITALRIYKNNVAEEIFLTG